MKTLPLVPVLLLALPLAAFAQTKPGPGDVTGARPAPPTTTTTANGDQQVVEVIEELDPATGRVIKRTTRTTTTPAAAPEAAEAPAVARPAPAARPAATPAPAPRTTATARATTRATTAAPARPSSEDALVSDFLREGVSLKRLPASELPRIYDLFIEKVRADRRQWKPANWDNAAAVLARLNTRYDEVRQDLSLEDRISIRADQGEFQTLRTARQVSDQVTNKL